MSQYEKNQFSAKNDNPLTRKVPQLSTSQKTFYSKIKPMTLTELDTAFIRAGLKKLETGDKK